MRWLSGCVRIIPGWVPANAITLTRALFLVPIYFTYQNKVAAWVIVLFFLAWFTDLLDGWHARYRNQISSFGKLLDPAVDKVFIVGLLLLIAPGRITSYVLYVTIGLEVVIILLSLALGPVSRWLFHTGIKLGANSCGKAKMTFQGIGVAFLVVGLNIRWMQITAEAFLWLAAVFAVVSLVFYIKTKEN